MYESLLINLRTSCSIFWNTIYIVQPYTVSMERREGYSDHYIYLKVHVGCERCNKLH